MMPNSVVLPAPFGPMMPSASPSSSARLIPSAMTIAPKRLEIFSRARMVGMPELRSPHGAKRNAGKAVPDFASLHPGYGAILRQQLQLAADRNFRGRLVGDDDEVELVALALPLAGDEGRLGDVLHRLAGPFHRPDHRVVVGRDDRGEDSLRVEALGALEHVDRHFEQRVLEADRLRPWPLGCARIGMGELLRALASETRLERMVRRPPDLAGEPVPTGPERVDHRREEQRLA